MRLKEVLFGSMFWRFAKLVNSLPVSADYFAVVECV